MLSAELAALAQRLSELGRPVVNLLAPGLSRIEVEERFGGVVPDEVATWFGWCNGARYEDGQIQDDVNLIPGYAPLSLDEAIQAKEDYVGDPVLAPQWVPFLGGPGGDLYAAVWNSGGTLGVAGVLVGEPTEIEFEDIEKMISFFRACYERGVFYVDDQGRLAMNPGEYESLYDEIVGN